MSFGKKRIAGVDYDLGHLDAFRLEVKPKEEAAPTYVPQPEHFMKVASFRFCVVIECLPWAQIFLQALFGCF